MKISRTLIAVLAASALITTAAFAKSHHHKPHACKTQVTQLDASNPNAEKACQDAGGKVVKNKQGNNDCVNKACAKVAAKAKGKDNKPKEENKKEAANDEQKELATNQQAAQEENNIEESTN